MAKWWVTLTQPGGVQGGGGELTANFVQAATAPAKKGDVWGVFGPWPTAAAAEKAWQDGSYQNHAVTPPGDSSPVINTIVSGNPNGNQGGGSSGFLDALTQKNTWIRVAEVVLGLALIIVGLAKLTGAGDIAKQAAKVAARTGLAAA